MPNTPVQAAAEGLPNPMPRRGFLAGLASLPLVGGGLTLIGRPTASAEPVTPALLCTYADWLLLERRMLLGDMYPDLNDRQWGRARDLVTMADDRASGFVYTPGAIPAAPANRAALVLSAVGCDWRA